MIKEILLPIPGPIFLIIYILFCVVLLGISLLILNFEWSIKRKLPNLLSSYEIAYLRDGIKGVLESAIVSLISKRKIIVNLGYATITGEDEENLDKIERRVLSFLKKNSSLTALLYSKSFIKNLKNSLTSIRVKLEKEKLIIDEKYRIKRAIILIIDYILIFIFGGTKIVLGLYREKPTVFLIILFIASIIIFKIAIYNKNKRLTELGNFYMKNMEKNMEFMKAKILSDDNNTEKDIVFTAAVFGTGIFITIPIFAELAAFFNSKNIQTFDNMGGGGSSGGSCSGCSSGCSSCSGCGGCGGCGGGD